MFEIKAKGEKKAEVLIYDDIGEGWFGGITAKQFADELKKVGKVDEITVRINSAGGSVFDGIAIYNTLKKNSARIIVNVDGIAASIASIIAMAGDEVYMADNAFMMIHDPWTVGLGTANDFRELAATMDKLRETLVDTYMKKASAERDTISKMMTDETWLTAKEALEVGLVDGVTEELAIAAHADRRILAKYKHVPESLTVTDQPAPRLAARALQFAKMNKTMHKYAI